MGLVIPVVLGALALAICYALIFSGKREKNLPPGPPTLPVIGNLAAIPTKGAHLKFTEWAKEYGGIFSLKLGSGTAIVITDCRLIKQLIDKKSNIYSHRPHSYVSHELITGGDHVLTMQYSDLWRSYRRMIHQYFMESVVDKEHIIVQDAEAVQMIHDYMVMPEDHMLHPKRYSNSITMSLVFGIRTPDVRTDHMRRLYDLMEDWSVVMEPGNTPPVDIFPILHWVPERVFGNWRARASDVGKQMNLLYTETLEKVEKRRRTEGDKGSFIDRIIDQNDKLGYTRHQIYFLTGTLMEGGSDTSSSIIIAFVQAMIKWPEVLKKAQAEVDAVVGEDRTPQWSDYEKLPYVAACVKEAMRWRPVVPLAFPHCLAEDDWVDGYFLPKNSIVFINGWGMQMDDEKFPDPDTFNPDHYKGEMRLAPELAAAPDPEQRDHWAYGSGRRICPGIHLAERNLWLAIAKLLWAFSLSSKPFDCDIKVRSDARRETIMREYATAKKDVFSRFQTP